MVSPRLNRWRRDGCHDANLLACVECQRTSSVTSIAPSEHPCEHVTNPVTLRPLRRCSALTVKSSPGCSGAPQQSSLLSAPESALATGSDGGNSRKPSTSTGLSHRRGCRQSSPIAPGLLGRDRGSTRQPHGAPASGRGRGTRHRRRLPQTTGPRQAAHNAQAFDREAGATTLVPARQRGQCAESAHPPGRSHSPAIGPTPDECIGDKGMAHERNIASVERAVAIARVGVGCAGHQSRIGDEQLQTVPGLGALSVA